jgi:hypothetical protein
MTLFVFELNGLPQTPLGLIGDEQYSYFHIFHFLFSIFPFSIFHFPFFVICSLRLASACFGFAQQPSLSRRRSG